MQVGTSWLRDFKVVDDSGSSVSFTGDDIVRIQTATTSDRGYIYKRIPAFRGEKIILSFMAKVNNGTLGVAIDYPSISQQKAISTITTSWERHTISFVVPDDNSDGDYLQLTIGQYTGHYGDCYITDVKIEVENSKLSFPRIYALALLTIASGVVTINSSFSTIGINRNIEGTSVTNSLTLKLVTPNVSNDTQAAPIFYASFTSDNPSFYKIICKIGSYNRLTGEVKIVFINSTTGSLIDISSLGYNHLWIQALGS